MGDPVSPTRNADPAEVVLLRPAGIPLCFAALKVRGSSQPLLFVDDRQGFEP